MTRHMIFSRKPFTSGGSGPQGRAGAKRRSRFPFLYGPARAFPSPLSQSDGFEAEPFRFGREDAGEQQVSERQRGEDEEHGRATQQTDDVEKGERFDLALRTLQTFTTTSDQRDTPTLITNLTAIARPTPALAPVTTTVCCFYSYGQSLSSTAHLRLRGSDSIRPMRHRAKHKLPIRCDGSQIM